MGRATYLDGVIGPRVRWAVTLLAGAAAALAGFSGIREFDQWHHMAWGRAFLRSGFPDHDFFLFTFADKPAPPLYEWLGSVGIYLAWLVGGEAGTVVLIGLLVGITGALIVWDGLEGDGEPRWVDVAIALLVASLAVGVIRVRAVGRPEIFCYPLLAWTLLAARRWIEGRGRSILAFPVVALLWANVHATVTYGLGAVLLVAGEAWLRARREGPEDGRRRRAIQLCALGMAGALLTFVTPSGSPLLLGLRYVGSSLGIHVGPAFDAAVQQGLDLMHGSIIELQPPGRETYLSSAGAYLLLLAIGFLVAWRAARPAELVLSVVALYLALHAVRFFPLLAIISAAATIRNLRAAAARVTGRARVALWGLVAAAPGAAVLAVSLPSFPLSFSRAEEIFPARAADVLRAADAGSVPGLRVYNAVHFGGFLEWALDAPVFYNDGRLLFPPGEAAFSLAVGGSHDVGKLDATWRFDALVLENLRFENPESWRAVQGLSFDLLANRRDFALVAIDDGAQLYVRRDGRLSGLLASEYRVVSPTRILTSSDFEDGYFVSRFRSEMGRAVAENPSCLYCKVGLYLGDLAAGNADAAERIFPDGRLPTTQHPLGNSSLEALGEGLNNLAHLKMVEGLAAIAGGDAARAERFFRLSVLAAETAPARNRLGQLLAMRGNLGEAERQLRRAIELEDGFMEPRLHLAMVLLSSGRDAEARALYREVVGRAPGSREGQFAKGRLAELAGRGR